MRDAAAINGVMPDEIANDDLRRHLAAHTGISGCPLLDGNSVRLLDSGRGAVSAILAAVAAAQESVYLEYYTVADLKATIGPAAGRSLGEILRERAQAGVEIGLIYDAVGSDGTPNAFFDGLSEAGIRLVEYRPLNPLKRRFSLRINDRDHRKIAAIDGRIGFMGGVNLSLVYETPASAGRGPDPDHGFWLDNAVAVEGPAVAEIRALFRASWDRLEGAALPRLAAAPRPRWPSADPQRDLPRGEVVRVAGSAPHERRPLYNLSLMAAVRKARRHILLATGYFVPTPHEWHALTAAARRGVEVRLLLAGYSDVPACTHAARALYGRLLSAGVHVHEVREAMLHAKVATIDGVWTAIGSSNLDWRSLYYNNEADAVILGQETAAAVEGMLRRQIGEAAEISADDWRNRSQHERLGELAARLWKRLM